MGAPPANTTVRLPVIATIGNPNTGKSTLFNALTGMRQKVGNYPGVTVEQVIGTAKLACGEVTLVDLPGTYSLTAQSPDEMVTVDVLLGKIENIGTPDAILVVVDASNLRRNLFLATQLLELDTPVVIALNMMDLAPECGITIDVERLAKELCVPVVPVVASRREGIDALRNALNEAITSRPVPDLKINRRLYEASRELSDALRALGHDLMRLEVERALIDEGGFAEARFLALDTPNLGKRLEATRNAIGHGRNLATLEARDRYSFITRTLEAAERRVAMPRVWSDYVDSVLNHPVSGSLIFILTMATVFQSVFAWATPIMDAIGSATVWTADAVEANLPPGIVSSFLSNGVVAGVGAVIVFLPQIMILFAFIILLEDTGYMSRAAFLMDRLMRWCGLSGQSFIPMLSSFACAVPGIMATRVISDPRSRLATILAAPFVTCSARLPVYALLIAAFVPRQQYLGGFINLQGLVLLGLYLLGMLGAVLTAYFLNKTLLKGPAPRFLLEMPPYRWPNARSVAVKLWGRVKIFLRRAGTVIFAVAVVVWFLASFPHHPHETASALEAQRDLESSYLGTASRVVAPLFSPLGWDWKVTAAVLASFPAREVVIAVLGTIYAVDADAEDGAQTITSRIKAAQHADGSPVYTLPMAVGLMVFYALCLQCFSTVAVMRRETNSWRWPIFSWFYMTGLAYIGALLCYQLGSAITTA